MSYDKIKEGRNLKWIVFLRAIVRLFVILEDFGFIGVFFCLRLEKMVLFCKCKEGWYSILNWTDYMFGYVYFVF